MGMAVEALMRARSTAQTVFVIDDDDAVRDSLKLLLESHALLVRDFASAPEFLAALDATPSGCLILDLQLPVIGGLDFLCRYSDRLGGMPVIVLTGRANAATRSRARKAGVMEFLEKPVADDLLIAAIDRALSRGRAGVRGA
jgi:two-component system response regulator FixJ